MPIHGRLSPLQFDITPGRTFPGSKRVLPQESTSDQGPSQRPRVRLILGPRPPSPTSSLSSDDDPDFEAENNAGRKGKGKARAGTRTKRKKKCNRKGDAGRVGGQKDIGQVACAHGACHDCDSCRGAGYRNGGEGDGNNSGEDEVDPPKERGGQREGGSTASLSQKKGKKQPWIVDRTGGPPLTLRAGQFLAQILGILTTSSRLDLEEMLTGLPTIASGVTCSTLDAAVERVKQLHVGMHQYELTYMLALIQLTLHVDRRVFFFAVIPSTDCSLQREEGSLSSRSF